MQLTCANIKYSASMQMVYTSIYNAFVLPMWFMICFDPNKWKDSQVVCWAEIVLHGHIVLVAWKQDMSTPNGQWQQTPRNYAYITYVKYGSSATNNTCSNWQGRRSDRTHATRNRGMRVWHGKCMHIAYAGMHQRTIGDKHIVIVWHIVACDGSPKIVAHNRVYTFSTQCYITMRIDMQQ